MSNIFNFCCVKDPEGVKEHLSKMEQTNGHFVPATCPFNSDSVVKMDGEQAAKPNLRVKVPQPMRLRNHLVQEQNFDTLHSKIDDMSVNNTKCTEKVCQGSIMDITTRANTPRTVTEIYHDAELFLKEYFASIHRENTDAHTARLEEVNMQLKEKGTYQLKTSELVFGAKLAWRNASRCIGRIQWKKLQIFDCREVTTASGMFEALCNHIKYATNKGNIRSAITVFPQRTDGNHDYRVWNPQLISYAGYVQPDGSVVGDPSKTEFTEVCLKLGWKSKRTAWDILPLVLSADGKDPEFFEIPPEIIMEVQLEHPNYDWFTGLGLKWYALPAVANMKLDCGGLEFTGTAFNGWYMGTEIGCRNLCDSNRLNVIERVATKMGLNTSSNASLWRDKALVEVNIAVLLSFHRDNVSIVDHHSASDQFIKHLDQENRSREADDDKVEGGRELRLDSSTSEELAILPLIVGTQQCYQHCYYGDKLRGGCPSDWIWIVPPMSGSLTAVFHQEMALYYIKPSYDYQEAAWKTHQWSKSAGHKTGHRKFHFKQIARAVKFTSKLFGRALSKRIKATILYATETGKSEQYAKELGTIFGYAFNAQVHSMADYDMFSIEHETLVVIVTSTFGNGEPPANGVDFAEHLFKMLYNETKHRGDQTRDNNLGNIKVPTPKSLMRTNSMMTPSIDFKRQLSRLESNKSSIADSSTAEMIGPLSNVCFAVFALGSSAYPKFCNFGKTVDKILGDLGGERLLDVACGDELYGQEQQFRSWSSNIFHVACETFCLEENDMVMDAKNALGTMPLSEETVRFGKPHTEITLQCALESSFRKQLISCTVKENTMLGDYTADRATIFVNLEPDHEVKYEPGDHVGIMACNRREIVESILDRLNVKKYDDPVQLQVMNETLTPTGSVKSWETHERLPTCTVRNLFSRFLDITTPPSTTILKYLASKCTDESEALQITELITDSIKYDDWRHFHYPHLAEVLEQFPSCQPEASMLAALLPPLQPRFYSISSSPLAHKNSIHITVAIVKYKTQNGNGPMHYGVCSTYLQSTAPGDEILLFTKRAPSFHMPKDLTAPLILIGPGSGIAPFRGFWNHRRQQIQNLTTNNEEPGPIWLFFGCRNRGMDLYKDEKEQALKEGVLTKVKLALSREKDFDKKHVQSLLEDEGAEVTRLLVDKDGHFYVCGDCKMAEEVQQKLKIILKKHACMTDPEVDDFILEMMDENRYHEDIFGITLRTAEVQSASREFAKKTRLASTETQS